jgi:CTP synthase
LAEIVEIPAHPYFVAAQFHPEYKSTVMNPHPLFVSFVKAAGEYHQMHGVESRLESANNG